MDCAKSPNYAPVYRYLAIVNSTECECRSCINAFPIPIRNTTVAVWRAC